jgi:uncharacterized protein (TIGR03435 family)
MAGVPLAVPNDKLPEFDVADIQVTKDTTGRPRAQFLPGGRVQFFSLPLKFMVLAAWGWENDEGRVTGGPSWVGSEQFDIVAKAPPDSTIATLRLMLRSLLIKRFGLEMHIEDQMQPVYALEKGKGEPKLTKSPEEKPLNCERSNQDGVITVNCHNMSLDELATGLRGMAPAYVDRPVVNLTGLSGKFDFKLGWTPRGQLLGTAGEGRGSAAEPHLERGVVAASEPTAGGRTVFEAVDHDLGLRLNSTKHAIPIVVIDKVNRVPTEN